MNCCHARKEAFDCTKLSVLKKTYNGIREIKNNICFFPTKGINPRLPDFVAYCFYVKINSFTFAVNVYVIFFLIDLFNNSRKRQ